MLVKYSRAFPIAPYGINEHIGLEIEIDDTTDIQLTIQKLRELSELSFKTAHPNAILSNEVITEQVLSKEQIAENTITEINKCESLVELKSFATFAKAHSKETFNAYQEKLKQFK